MTAAPTADPAASVAWLKAWHADGPWVIAEIDPTVDNPPIRAREFTDPESLAFYLESRAGVVNLYWLPNTTIPGITTTPRKDQMVLACALYVDFDLPRSGPFATPTPANFARLLARIRAISPAPTAIIFSGGGYQAFWLIRPPYPATEYLDRIEATGKSIARSLGSDAVQNINRWMRLPGTLNIPNDIKRARGRITTLAHIIEADWSRTWSYADPVPHLPDDFDDEPAPQAETLRGFNDIPTKWQRLVKSGDASGYGDDRSRLVLAIIIALISRGWRDEEILPFLVDERYGSSAHCNAASHPLDAARRQIERARHRHATGWERTTQGRIDPASPKNIRLAFAEIGVNLSYNTFADQMYVNGVGPLRQLDDPVESEIRILTYDRCGFIPQRDVQRDVTITMARIASYHPVVDYLQSLTHDNIHRTETWLIDLAGAEDTPYVRYVSQLVLVAAVRRVRQPGCKFDEMLVLVQPHQGTEKSTALATLAVHPDWFTDSLPLHASEQKVIEQLSGKWIVEHSDLHGMRQTDVEAIKAMLSRTWDRARLAYGRYPVNVPRQSIPIGTTNSTSFLRDVENRRFWPIAVQRFDISRLRAARDQLWAEAAAIEATGVSIRLPEYLWASAAVHQQHARLGDPWADTLAEHLSTITGKIASNDVWKILGRPEHVRSGPDNGRLTEAMTELGWERRLTRLNGYPTRCFIKGTPFEITRTIYVFRDPITQAVTVGHAPSPSDLTADF